MLIDERDSLLLEATSGSNDAESEAAAYMARVEKLLGKSRVDLSRELLELLTELAADESLTAEQREVVDEARARANALWVKVR